MSFIVIYDACVLYPAPLRDLLLELAISELFAAKWTEAIHDEWIRGLLRSRPELEERLHNTRRLMNEAVPDSLVKNFEPLIDGRIAVRDTLRFDPLGCIDDEQRTFTRREAPRYLV